MWFDKKRRPMAEHWPTERMITENHSDYATPGDIEGLATNLLVDIAQLCEVETAAPDECIPCLAYAIVMDREAEKTRLLQESLENPTGAPEAEEEPEERETPALDGLVAEETVFEPVPVAEQFRAKVEELHVLTEQMLSGPPIPPPNVTLEELAALMLGAKRWLAMLEGMGAALAPEQESIRTRIQAVVDRLG